MIVSRDPAKNTVNLDNKEVPGEMAAMKRFVLRHGREGEEGNDRASAIRSGIRAEAAVGVTAGVLARSILVTAFGINSVIELLSGAPPLWRMKNESSSDPERSRRVMASTLGLALLLTVVISN